MNQNFGLSKLFHQHFTSEKNAGNSEKQTNFIHLFKFFNSVLNEMPSSHLGSEAGLHRPRQNGDYNVQNRHSTQVFSLLVLMTDVTHTHTDEDQGDRTGCSIVLCHGYRPSVRLSSGLDEAGRIDWVREQIVVVDNRYVGCCDNFTWNIIYDQITYMYLNIWYI